MIEIALKNINGKDVPAVTSLQVAESFEKEHKNVLRDIEAILPQVPEKFVKLNFELYEYPIETGIGIGMLCECENPPLGSRREGYFFVSSVRLLRHESDLIPVLRQPPAFVQAPPRRDDEPSICFCFPVGMSPRHGTVQRT